MTYTVSGNRERKQISDAQKLKMVVQLQLLMSEVINPKGTYLDPEEVCRQLHRVREGFYGFEQAISEISLSSSIEDLDLSFELYQILKRSDIHTVEDLTMTPESKLFGKNRPRGFGTKRQAELVEAMNIRKIALLDSAGQMPVRYAFRRYYILQSRTYANTIDSPSVALELIESPMLVKMFEWDGLRVLDDFNLKTVTECIDRHLHMFAVDRRRLYKVHIQRSYNHGEDEPKISFEFETGLELTIKAVLEEVNTVLTKNGLPALSE